MSEKRSFKIRLSAIVLIAVFVISVSVAGCASYITKDDAQLFHANRMNTEAMAARISYDEKVPQYVKDYFEYELKWNRACDDLAHGKKFAEDVK